MASHTSERDAHAKLIVQKSFLHSLSIFELAKNSTLKVHNTGKDFSILDIQSINSLIRSQLEAYCCFNHVFTTPIGEAQSKFAHDSWMISGLNYRNTARAKMPEHKKKKIKERKELNELIVNVYKNRLVKTLTPDQHKKLKQFIKQKDWKCKIRNRKCYKLSWRDLLLNSGMKKSLFQDYYNYLSFNSHPTFISVLQLGDMYQGETAQNNLAIQLSMSRTVLNFLILDMVKYSKECSDYFFANKSKQQMLVILDNRVCRYKNIVEPILKNSRA